MKCTAIHELFTDYADGSLDDHQLTVIEEHLARCTDCSRNWQEYRQTVRLLQAIPLREPPADLLAGIHRKLAEKSLWQQLWQLVQAMDFSVPIPVAAATFALAMFAGFLVKTAVIDHAQPHTLQPNILLRGESAASRSLGFAISDRILPVSYGRQPQTAIGLNDRHEPWCPIAPIVFAAHQDARRILSPDLRILVESTGWDDQSVLARKMLRHNWQVHTLANDLLLIHLPAGDLAQLRRLLSRHQFSLMPDPATDPHFPSDRKILTAAIRFH